MLQKLITIQSFAMLSVLASILVTFNNCTTTTNTFEDIEHLQIQSEEIDRLIQLPLNCIEHLIMPTKLVLRPNCTLFFGLFRLALIGTCTLDNGSFMANVKRRREKDGD
jgi:hypothetical protein